MISLTKIEPDTLNRIKFTWDHGISHVVSAINLRFHCPCASCVDEHSGMRRIKIQDLNAEVRCIGAKVVGRYAIQFDWSDGHSTGIYHFDHLSKLCETLESFEKVAKHEDQPHPKKDES